MSPDVPDVVVYVFAAVVVLSAVAASGAAVPAPSTDGVVAPQTTANETATATPESGSGNGTEANESIAPGQQLAGVVGVQGAEIDGEVAQRSLDERASRATSNESKAAVVASELNQIRDRLRTLRETQTELREAKRAGEISTGEYRARMAVTSAEIRTIRSRLDSTDRISRDLPEQALESNGVNRSEVDRLRQDADELQGEEVSEMARQIAGDPPGRQGAERDSGERPGSASGNGDEDDASGAADEAGNGTATERAGSANVTVEVGNGTVTARAGNGNAADGGDGDDDSGRSGETGPADGADGSAGDDTDARGDSGDTDARGSSDDSNGTDGSGDAANDDDAEGSATDGASD